MEQDDSGLWLRPKASLTPKINANLIQSRGLLRNGSAVGGAQGSQIADASNTKIGAAPSASLYTRAAASNEAVSNVNTERIRSLSPNIKPFRAGFAYERQQTPDYRVRQRQVQEQQHQQQRTQSASPPRGVLKHRHDIDITTANALTSPEAASSAPDAATGTQVTGAPAVGSESPALSKQKTLASQEQLSHHVQWDGTPSNTGSTCSHRSSSNTSTVSRANDSSTCNPAAPSSRTCSGTGSSPESSSTDSAAAAESATARPFTKGGLLRSSSRSRGSVTGCIAVRSAVVGGAGLLQGHMNGQAVDVLQSLVAESLAMLPPIQAATTAAAADHSTNPSHASSPMHSHSGSHPWSAGSSGSGASGRSRSTAAAAAVGYGKGGRRFRRNVSLPDEHEEDEAALVAMLMALPCSEPPAIQAAPEQFSLALVAAALGQNSQHLQQQKQQNMTSVIAAANAAAGTHGQDLYTYYPAPPTNEPNSATGSDSYVCNSYSNTYHNSSNTSNSASTRRPTSPSILAASLRPTSANSNTNNKGNNRVNNTVRIAPEAVQQAAVANNAVARLPLQTEVQGVELKLRAISAAPALAQQYTKAQMLLAQTFGPNLQQPAAAAAATVAAEAARSAAAAAAAAGATTGRSRAGTGPKSARKAAATEDDSAAAAAAAGAATANDTQMQSTAGGSKSRGTASPPPSSAAAAAGLSSVDPVSALLSGKQSPVRFRIMTASVEQQRKRQQQRLLSASCGFASSSSSDASALKLRNSWDAGTVGSISLLSKAAMQHQGNGSASAVAKTGAAAGSSIWAPGASGASGACNCGSSSSRSTAFGCTEGSLRQGGCVAGVAAVVADKGPSNCLALQGQGDVGVFRGLGSGMHGCWSKGRVTSEDDKACNSGSDSFREAYGVMQGIGCESSSAGGTDTAAAGGEQHKRQQQRCRFGFETHLEHLENQWKQPTADQVDAEVALSAPSAADVSTSFAWGDVGRLLRRYQQQTDYYPAAFNLNTALSGRQQVAALAQAIPQMPELTALLLQNNDLDDWALQTLTTAILQPGCSGISCLDLGYNRLTSQAPMILLPLLHRPPRKAAAAAAGGNSEAMQGYRRTGSAGAAVRRRSTCDAVAGPSQGLAESGHAMLTQLVLAGNLLGDAGTEVVCQLVATGDSMLQLLDMSRCGITDRVAGCLRGLLEGARQLQVLRMGWNNLGPKGGKALAEGLKYCSTLQQLLLPWSGIRDTGASHIAKAMESNSSVKLLDMSGCQVSAATCVVLVETLSVNKELGLLVLQDNPLGALGAHKLLRAVHAGQVKHVDIAGCSFLSPSTITAHNPAAAAAGVSAASPPAAAAAAAAASKQSSKSSRGASADAAGSGKKGKGKGAAAPAPGAASTTAKVVGGGGGVGAAAAAFNAREPDGAYKLDLSSPSDRQVAIELLKLAADHGTDSWVNPTLNQKPYSIAGVTKQQLPSSGILTVTFVAKHKPNWEATPLTEAEFDSMWTTLVNPHRLARTAAALESELGLLAKGYGGAKKQNSRNQGAKPVPAVAGLLGIVSGSGSSGLGLGDKQQHAEDTVFVTQSAGVTASGAANSNAAAAGCDRAASPKQQQQQQQSSSDSSAKVPGSNPSACNSPVQKAARDYTSTSWFGGMGYGSLQDGVAVGSSSGGGGPDSSVHLHAVTDGWKMELLQVLTEDCYFTSSQAREMVSAFSYGEDKVDAAVKVFGRVVDPESFASQVYTTLNAWQVELADARIGCLRLFSPANPTGKYSLLLSHPAQRLVAVRLLELYCQQHIEGYCAFPHSVCFTSAALDEQGLPAAQLAEPTSINLPRSGLFKVTFVDLKPIPEEAKPLSPEGFAVLVSVLVSSKHLDALELAEAVDDVDVATKVKFVGRFDTWNNTHGPFTGKVSALQRLAPGTKAVTVKDMERFVETMHIFAIHHYLTGSQLIELVKLLPESASQQRVELCSCFWARLTDRAKTWSDVMRALSNEQQVALAQRLGYANVFDPVRPAMHYRLRMWRTDEHQIAWRLHRMALTAKDQCFVNFAIDGVLKKISENANLWSVMRGSAGDKDTPTVTLDFDFAWEDGQLPHWAAVTIQAAWRAYKIRKANPTPINVTYRASRPSTANGVRASTRLGARPSIAGGSHLLASLSEGGTAAAAAAGGGAGRPSMLARPGTGSSISSYHPSAAGYARSPLGSPMKGFNGVKPDWDTVHVSRSMSSAAGEGLSVKMDYEMPQLSRMGKSVAADFAGLVAADMGPGSSD